MKANSQSKAVQAWELGDSLLRDVIEPMKKLRSAQDREAQEVQTQGEQLMQALAQRQDEVKSHATSYQRAAKQAISLVEDAAKIRESD